LTQDQRRDSSRLEIKIVSEYIPLDENMSGITYKDGYILNISRSGALYTVDEPLELEEEIMILFNITLRVTSRDRVIPTVVRGKLVREHRLPKDSRLNLGYTYGLEFDQPFSALL